MGLWLAGKLGMGRQDSELTSADPIDWLLRLIRRSRPREDAIAGGLYILLRREGVDGRIGAYLLVTGHISGIELSGRRIECSKIGLGGEVLVEEVEGVKLGRY